SVMAQHGKPKWHGLEDNDTWQIQNPDHPSDYDKRRLRELDFWFGKRGVSAAHPVHTDDAAGTDTASAASPRHRSARHPAAAALSAARPPARKPARTTRRKR